MRECIIINPKSNTTQSNILYNPIRHNLTEHNLTQVDTNLPFAWGSVFACVFNLLGTFVTVVVITKWLIVSAVPIGYLYMKVMTKYLTASREVQRMQQMSISPVLTYMGT